MLFSLRKEIINLFKQINVMSYYTHQGNFGSGENRQSFDAGKTQRVSNMDILATELLVFFFPRLSLNLWQQHQRYPLSVVHI